MRGVERFPDDQAQIVFSDVFVEYLEKLSLPEREAVLVDLLRLCQHPIGAHPLGNRGADGHLAGWNTVAVLHRELRVVYASRIIRGVGVIEVLCAGPRRDDAAYDMAGALVASGLLTDAEVTEIWQALSLLDVLAEEVGLDGWDYRPPAAPDGLVRAAVASGVIEEHLARLLSADELQAAMTEGWGADGPDPDRALSAALHRARTGVTPVDLSWIIERRADDRCDVVLPRTGDRCIRRRGHPGVHRGSR